MFLNFICFIIFISPAFCNTYATEKNTVEKEYFIDSPLSTVKTINLAPLKTQRLNLVWEQAVKKFGKFYPKLDRLYADLKLQDKEELNWRAEKEKNLDKDGLKEELIQKNFKAILLMYHLNDEYLALPESVLKSAEQEFTFPHYVDKNGVFKDRKLNELWLEAEKQGFSEEELRTLKLKFQHQQTFIDFYDHLDIVLFVSRRFIKGKLGDKEIDPMETLVQVEIGEAILNDMHAALETGYNYLKSSMITLKRKKVKSPEMACFTLEQYHSIMNGLQQCVKTGTNLISLIENEKELYDELIKITKQFIEDILKNIMKGQRMLNDSEQLLQGR